MIRPVELSSGRVGVRRLHPAEVVGADMAGYPKVAADWLLDIVARAVTIGGHPVAEADALDVTAELDLDEVLRVLDAAGADELWPLQVLAGALVELQHRVDHRRRVEASVGARRWGGRR